MLAVLPPENRVYLDWQRRCLMISRNVPPFEAKALLNIADEIDAEARRVSDARQAEYRRREKEQAKESRRRERERRGN